MSKGTRIDEVEAALVELLKQKLPEVRTIRAITGGDLDENQDVILQTPEAVLLLFKGEVLDRRRDHVALTYQSGQAFLAICGVTSFQSREKERRSAHQLLNDVSDVLAGARLTLPSSTQRPQVVLRRADLWQFDRNSTWYALEVMVDSVAQFSGVAA